MKLSPLKFIIPLILVIAAGTYGLIQSQKQNPLNESEAVIGITSKHWINEHQVIEKKGSGFIISKEGLIVTAAHVLGNQIASYGILFEDGTKFPADKVFEDTELDITLLKLVAPENSDFPYLALAETENLKEDDQVSSYFFNHEDMSIIRNDGVLEGIFSDSQTPLPLLQSTASIIKSGSGGPMLNKRGEVIGINVAILKEDPAMTLSIPVEVIKESLKE